MAELVSRSLTTEDLPGSAPLVLAPADTNLDLKTTTDSKPVRINSRNYTQASGDSIGFQATPNQTVTTTGEVFGAQLKPASPVASTPPP